MGTMCSPLVSEWLLFRYERDFMLSLSDRNQSAFIQPYLKICR